MKQSLDAVAGSYLLVADVAIGGEFSGTMQRSTSMQQSKYREYVGKKGKTCRALTYSPRRLSGDGVARALAQELTSR